MGTTLWFLFVLSIPVFYIMGIIHFFSGGKKVASDVVEQFAEKMLAIKPEMTVREMLERYRETNKVKEVAGQNPSGPVDTGPSPSATTNLRLEKVDSVSNWYSNNSINVLLYVGAFLVVTAAFYFVQFQWSSITGVEKSGVFSVFAAAFLVLGMWLEKQQKIRTAGITFISIGAVLIPLSGIAWYNFVFEPAGVEMGVVWLMTSLITIGLYGYLLNKYKYLGCTYALNLAVFSSVLSIVNLSRPEMNIYLIASLTYGIVMLVVAHYLATRAPEKLIVNPLSSTAQMLVPLVLFASVRVALINGSFLSGEMAYTLVLGTVFYGVAYFFNRKSWNLLAGLILLPLAMVSFLGWQEVTTTNVLIVLSYMGIVYGIGAWMLDVKYKEEKEMILVVGFLITLLANFWVVVNTIMPGIRCWLMLDLGIVAVMAAVSLRRPRLAVVTSIFVGIAINILYSEVLMINPNGILVTGTYLTIAALLVLTSELTFLSKELSETLTYCSLVFGIGGGLTSGMVSGARVISWWMLAVIIGRLAWRKQSKEMVYLAIGLFVAGVMTYFNLVKLNAMFKPLVYAILGGSVYMMSFGIPDFFRRQMKLSGLLMVIILPYLTGQIYGGQKWAIMSFYLATFLYTTEAYLSKSIYVGYMASALGMITYMWQIQYLGVEETLAYNIPLGVYFLGLGQHRRKLADIGGQKMLEMIGFGIILLPTFFLAFGDRSIYYSLALGMVGIGLLILGITITQKNITNAGIVGIVMSILPQSYQYVLRLPRFVLIGVFGLTFLIVAISLLWKRKEE